MIPQRPYLYYIETNGDEPDIDKSWSAAVRERSTMKIIARVAYTDYDTACSLLEAHGYRKDRSLCRAKVRKRLGRDSS